MNLVGSRTQISVCYASAFLVPGWQLLTLCLYAGPVAWIMLFLIRQWTILYGGLDNFSLWLPLCGCTCQVVRGFPTFAPCLEHICAGGGGV